MKEKEEKFNPTLPRMYPLKEDVVGKAREFVENFQENIKGKNIYKTLGISPEKTYLINGPPGIGKTMGINALNNSMNSHLIKKIEEILLTKGYEGEDIRLSEFNLLLFEYDIGKYGTAYINMGSRKIQDFFDTAFTYAGLGKNVLISLDEADSLFISRKSKVQSHSEDRKVLN